MNPPYRSPRRFMRSCVHLRCGVACLYSLDFLLQSLDRRGTTSTYSGHHGSQFAKAPHAEYADTGSLYDDRDRKSTIFERHTGSIRSGYDNGQSSGSVSRSTRDPRHKGSQRDEPQYWGDAHSHSYNRVPESGRFYVNERSGGSTANVDRGKSGKGSLLSRLSYK